MNDQLIYDIIHAIAVDHGVEPENLSITLADYINADALARFDRGEWELTFSVEDRIVTVDHTGDVDVDTNRIKAGHPE